MCSAARCGSIPHVTTNPEAWHWPHDSVINRMNGHDFWKKLIKGLSLTSLLV